MLVRAVICDFDGVLNDSFREGLRRIKLLAAAEDIPFGARQRRKLQELWGVPGRELLCKGLDVSEAMADAMYEKWKRMDKNELMPLIPGAKETLYWLRKNHIATGLLTTRDHDDMEIILDRHDLFSKLSVVSTGKDTPSQHKKPHPFAFRHVLERLSEELELSEEENIKDYCIFVGDTPVDLEAGKSAGVRTLIVQTGPYLVEHMETNPAPFSDLLHSIDDLPFWIEKHHDGHLPWEYAV